jgi:hypothetical protein
MRCMHPFCPNGEGLENWAAVVESPELKISARHQEGILQALDQVSHLNGSRHVVDEQLMNSAPFGRILEASPCLYAQLAKRVTPKAVVHLCEVTLGQSINSRNVFDAFKIQHPNNRDFDFLHPPVTPGAGGGDIMEQLCSEVLTNHGVPHAELDAAGWPVWASKSHISLNTGRMTALKLYGDILVPMAPHNLLISVKSEAARERFVVSGNRLESVGFGFFNDASEFWTTNRMNLIRRWGFSAVYMPAPTLLALEAKLSSTGRGSQAININGRRLFRPLEEFGDDIYRVAGCLSIEL